jgi:hypothetical protein
MALVRGTCDKYVCGRVGGILAFYSVALVGWPMSGGCADSSNENDWTQSNNRPGFAPAFRSKSLPRIEPSDLIGTTI